MKRLFLAAPVALAVTVLSALVGAAPAGAAAPFSDPAAIGKLTLCDVRNHVVTHGSVDTKPFVWRAIGSAPPTGPYAGQRRTAALYGYQPVKDLDPSQWNGEFLTAGSHYGNALHPIAAATAVDPSLQDLLVAYPPKWNGLIQLRMFLGAAGAATLTSSYNAAVIRISGSTWSLVDGGHQSCTNPRSVSAEEVLPTVRKLGTPAPNATTDVPSRGKRASARATAHAPSTSAASLDAGPSGGSSVAGSREAISAAAHHSSVGGGSGDPAWPWILGALAVVAAGAVVAIRRLRPAGRS